MFGLVLANGEEDFVKSSYSIHDASLELSLIIAARAMSARPRQVEHRTTVQGYCVCRFLSFLLPPPCESLLGSFLIDKGTGYVLWSAGLLVPMVGTVSQTRIQDTDEFARLVNSGLLTKIRPSIYWSSRRLVRSSKSCNGAGDPRPTHPRPLQTYT